MPVNRNALIRYKTIDNCLQNRYRTWTLEDLIEACSDALYEYEGIKKGISKRSVQLDIQFMRSDKLGYNAPIIVYDNKYYTYEDPEYSITNIPLTEKDLGKLTEAVEFMKQFKGFSHFRELDSMVQKLEDHVYSQKKDQKPVIDFEKNEDLRGLEHLEGLYQAIIKQQAISITYQSFKARNASSFTFHPYLLKEFRNRWFLVGLRKEKEPVLTLALDRILGIKTSDEAFKQRTDFDANEYFNDVVGVTVEPGKAPERVVLFVNHQHAQYVITKPFHHSQKTLSKDSHGITIELNVQHNFELEKEILGLGDGIMVLAPERLKRSITGRVNNLIDLYDTSITEKNISKLQQKLEHRGAAYINKIYTTKSIRQLASILHKRGYFENDEPVCHLAHEKQNSDLSRILINKNIERIIDEIPGKHILKDIVLYQSIPADFFEWGQRDDESALSLIIFLEHRRVSSYTIEVVMGSHNKKFKRQELELIVENSTPSEISLYPGGALLLKPMLLRRFSQNLKDKRIRFIEMRFGS